MLRFLSLIQKLGRYPASQSTTGDMSYTLSNDSNRTCVLGDNDCENLLHCCVVAQATHATGNVEVIYGTLA